MISGADFNRDDVRPTVFLVGLDPPLQAQVTEWLRVDGRFAVRTLQGHAGLSATVAACGSGVVVVDVGGLSGSEQIVTLRATPAPMPVIALTARADFEVVVGAFRAGASDVVDLPIAEHTLLERVSRAAREDQRRVSQRTLFWRVNELMSSLTPREREVMRCVVDGNANKQIAYELGISEKTVEVHRHKVMRKMEANSLAALVRMTVLMEASGAQEALRN